MLAALTFLGQEFAWRDLGIIGLLVLLEGALSIDNALVLGLLAKRLPKSQQKKALTYGLVGAFAFRFIAVFMASKLLEWHVVKLLGGGYLVYISVKHLFFEAGDEDGEVTLSDLNSPMLVDERTGEPLTAEQEQRELRQRALLPLGELHEAPQAPAAISHPVGGRKFWSTVGVIELTDIAFAVDSILAAIGVVGSVPKDHPEGAVHPKLWVVIIGGLLGVVLMRFAAAMFIRLLEKFPRFSTAAYLLVLVIGGKLLVDWWFNTKEDPHRVDFHSPGGAAFWVFWGLMIVCFATGFLPKRDRPDQTTAEN
jgi:YkoY family integral membrane protein